MNISDVLNTVKSWAVAEFKALSTAELALLKSELPTLEKAGALALEDFIIQCAQSVEAIVGLTGPAKAASVGTMLEGALSVGLAVVGGQPVQGSISTTAKNMLIEAGATAVRVGVAALSGNPTSSAVK